MCIPVMLHDLPSHKMKENNKTINDRNNECDHALQQILEWLIPKPIEYICKIELYNDNTNLKNGSQRIIFIMRTLK